MQKNLATWEDPFSRALYMIQDFFIALPSTAPALNSQHICDPSGFDAEMWHSLELKVTASVFHFFKCVYIYPENFYI